jgi:NAD(P) transhydrogenase
MQQGRVAACHALGLMFGVAVDQTASSAVYGLPEVAGVGATEEQVRATGIPYVVGRCDLATIARGAIAGHGGRLKLIFRADDRKLLGVHCIGDIASEVVGLGHVVLHVGGAVELFLTLGLNTPTYSAAYHDAAVDGLARLAKLINPGAVAPVP